MAWHSQIVTAGPVSIDTYTDGSGSGADMVILPSYGRDGGADFDSLTAALVGAGYRVLRPQPRAQLGPRVTTTVIANASHALFPEQPAAAASAVLDYLRTLDVPVSAAGRNL